MSDKVEIGIVCKLDIDKSDRFEVGKVQVGKVEVGKAKVGNLDTPKFFDTSPDLGTNRKVKNTRRRTKLLRKRDILTFSFL